MIFFVFRTRLIMVKLTVVGIFSFFYVCSLFEFLILINVWILIFVIWFNEFYSFEMRRQDIVWPLKWWTKIILWEMLCVTLLWKSKFIVLDNLLQLCINICLSFFHHFLCISCLSSECVKFCGYSIPHPTERKVIMQIQTHPRKGTTGLQVFEQGLQDLLSISQVIKNKFNEALDEHSSLMQSDDWFCNYGNLCEFRYQKLVKNAPKRIYISNLRLSIKLRQSVINFLIFGRFEINIFSNRKSD